MFPDLKNIPLDPGLLIFFEHDKQMQLFTNSLSRILNFPCQYLDSDFFIGSHALLNVEGEKVFDLFLETLTLLHYLKDLFCQELLILLSPLENPQQIG